MADTTDKNDPFARLDRFRRTVSTPRRIVPLRPTPSSEPAIVPMSSTPTSRRFYAGVGSRVTPPAVLNELRGLASTLEADGWTLRSGGAAGAKSNSGNRGRKSFGRRPNKSRWFKKAPSSSMPEGMPAPDTRTAAEKAWETRTHW